MGSWSGLLLVQCEDRYDRYDRYEDEDEDEDEYEDEYEDDEYEDDENEEGYVDIWMTTTMYDSRSVSISKRRSMYTYKSMQPWCMQVVTMARGWEGRGRE